MIQQFKYIPEFRGQNDDPQAALIQTIFIFLRSWFCNFGIFLIQTCEIFKVRIFAW